MFSDPVEGEIIETIVAALKEKFGDFKMGDIHTLGDENLYALEVGERLFCIEFPFSEDSFGDLREAFEQSVPWELNSDGHLVRSI